MLAFDTARANIAATCEQFQQPLPHQPISRQAAAAQAVVRRRGLLHLAKLQVDLALTFLQKHDNEAAELFNVDFKTSFILSRTRLKFMKALKDAREHVEEHSAWLAVEEEDVGYIVPHTDFTLLGMQPVQTSTVAQASTEAAAASVSQRESSPPVRPSTSAEGVAQKSPITTRADELFQLQTGQKKAYAASMLFRINPISRQTSRTLSCINERLNTQNTLPGSPSSRRNMMLHLHNIMNRQLLKEIPTDQKQLNNFFLAPNALSGLSGLSIVQMLTAALRASASPAIRAKIEEILSSHTVNQVPLVRLLDRTHESFVPSNNALALFDSPVAATASTHLKAFVQPVLEICKLALSELQIPESAR
ncbi:MAG: hypothetical protein ACRC9T_04210 [Vibrionaceae bacterium]